MNGKASSSSACADTQRGAGKPVLAYSVQTEEYGCVRFAKSNAQARREGANEMDVDWESIDTCRRAPQFDCFAPGPVPDLAMWNDGWRFLCVECECSAEHWNDGRPVCDECAPAVGLTRTASSVGIAAGDEPQTKENSQ